ncbi:hypothetical protein [Zhihengliuella sp. ISTPL4]|uniref:hypothetical protein n=1 Tax=Zhihengliuella sp. ISTPL4 TaxID=2058657 RepID=UPI000C79C3A5|nr:hypothetical protein [Zhihengliuella sp. ISTPL4]
MSSSALTSLSPGIDPALRLAGLSELDVALSRLDEASTVLTVLREACAWDSEGVRALRIAMSRLSDDTAALRSTLQGCRARAEDA